MYRSSENSVFAGVCGGLAEYLGVDPTLVRAIFLALGLVGGVGVVLYLILWIAVPKRPENGDDASYMSPSAGDAAGDYSA